MCFSSRVSDMLKSCLIKTRIQKDILWNIQLTKKRLNKDKEWEALSTCRNEEIAHS